MDWARVKNIFIIAIKVIFIIFVIYFIYQLILKVFGGSWSNENIIVVGVGAIIAAIFGISVVLGRIDERTRHIGEGLNRLGKDFKTHMVDYHGGENV